MFDLEPDELDEIIKEFLVESSENVSRLEHGLLALENDPSSPELLAGVFRTVHSIKGACGFLGFGKLEKVAHVAESLLGRLRDGKITLNPEIATALLTTGDTIRAILADIETTRQDGQAEHEELIATLTRLGEGQPAHPVAAPDASAALPRPAAEPIAPAAADSTIRVDVELLDSLMNLAGELVLARNQILRSAAGQGGLVFVAASQRLDQVTTELQEGIMKTRMQPVNALWDKLPRVVRDLARDCGKQVRIEMEGRETELDRTVIEAMKDPLIHIVRNAVDHGIERPDVRLGRGKPAEGRILLKAFHGGGRVHLEISDDGAGIDPERVRQKALERGFITPEQAGRLSAAETVNLLFLPGFSTTEQVSNISGRGVGMDVVRSNIEGIGGTVEVHSRHGHGMTLTVRLPLTLTIIPVLIVRARGERYAIPQGSLLEVVRLADVSEGRGIETMHRVPVYRLRESLLPVVYLDRELGLTPSAAPAGNVPSAASLSLLVLQAGGHAFGLAVDAIEDTEEIVVKPLGRQLRGVPTFAGATVLGDGRVALILDVLGLARRAGVIAESANARAAARLPVVAERPAERQTHLLVGTREGRRVAIPLAGVERLEDLPRTALESGGHGEVVQYRGRIVPVVHLSTVTGRKRAECTEGERVQAVICTGHDGEVCLIVDHILDIVEEGAVVTQDAARGSVLGSAVVQQRVASLLDVDALLRRMRRRRPGGRQPAVAQA